MMNRLYLSISGTAWQSNDVANNNISYRKSKSFFKSVLVLITVLISLPQVYGQTVRTWLPTAGGVWTTATNWSPNGAPVAGDDVIINTQTANIVSVPSISLRNMTIDGNCTLLSSKKTITITGTFIVADGATLSLGTPSGNYLRLTLDIGAVGFIRGTARVAINSSSSQGYFNVKGSLTIEADALVTGNQNFRMYNGGTLIVANTSGITQTGPTGAIQVTGNRSYATGSNYVYNGSAPQVTGNGLAPNIPANLTIDNSAGVTLSVPTVISKMLTLSNGELNMDSYYLTAGSLTGSGNITGKYGNLVLQIGSDNTSPAPYSGIISNGTATSISVTKVGTGTLTLAGVNTYTGLTSINAGTFKLGASGSVTGSPLGTAASGTIVATGASLDLNGFTMGDEALTLNGTGISAGGALTNSSAATASFQGLINLNRASSIIATSGDINITNPGTITGSYPLTLGGAANGSISSIIGTGSGTISKTGAGTWTLSGANTFLGLVSISAGTLKLGSAGDATNTPLGTEAAGTTVSVGGTLDLNGFSLATMEALTLNGSGVSEGGALTNSSPTAVTYNGLIRLADPTSIIANAGDINITNPGRITGANLDLTLGGSGNGSLSSIVATNNGKMIKTGTGTWILLGVNTFGGGLDINAGTLQLGAANVIATQTVTLGGGTFSTGATIGYNETLGPLALTGNSFIELGTGVHRLNFSASNSQTWTSSASLTITGWQGSIGLSGTAGRIFVGATSGGLTAAQIAQIQFLIGGIYYSAAILNTGEIVPSTVISITTGTIPGSPFCAGAAVSVPFTVTGRFNSGNIFTAQLSDESGGFASPVSIGTSTVTGSITATIPITALSGTNYRIRVVSSAPVVTGSDNGSNLTILGGSSGTWLGITADWNSPLNWCGGILPSAGSDVFIPSNTPFQPVISNSPFATPVTCNTLTISPGASLTLNAGQALTVGNLLNSGTLYLKSDASGIASLKVNGTSPVTGTNNIEIYLTGGGGPDAYKWHYISSPVDGTGISAFNGNTQDLARYDEGLISTSVDDGWIAADGFIYKDGSFGSGFSSLSLGTGYSYYFGSDQTYTITGTINTNSVSVPLDYNKGGTGNPEIIGLNLIGNPFTCTLDWDVVAAFNGLPSAGISSAIYSTKDYNLSPTYVPGGPNPGTDGGTNTIPPMQAFFAEALATGQTLTLPASSKTHSSMPRFKGASETGKFPLIRLLIENGNSSRDAVIWFNEKATAAFDGSFDAYKLNKSFGAINVWTKLGKIDYAINGMTLPETSVEIPVGVHAETNGNYKLSANELTGLENYSVILKDKATNKSIDLSSGTKVTFSTTAGNAEDRFVITITNKKATGNEEVGITKKPFNIYAFNEILNIESLSDSWDGVKCIVKLTDITGRVYKIVKDAEFWKNSITQIPVTNAKGIYIVEISSGILRYTGKVMLR